MSSYLLLALLLFLGLLRYGLGKGARRLEALSRERRKTLGASARQLHPAERQALSASSGLAFPGDGAVLNLQGGMGVVGWRQPMFVLDDLLVGLPEQLLPCVRCHNEAQVLLNPHPGLPHAFVVALNGTSLVCECLALKTGFVPNDNEPATRVASPLFQEALPQVAPAFLRAGVDQ